MLHDDEIVSRSQELEKYANLELDLLKFDRYHICVVNPGVEKEKYIQDEICRFQQLFVRDQYEQEWHDLHDYPLLGDEELNLKELYRVAQDYEKGKYMAVLMSSDTVRQKLMAKVMAIKEYIKFLETEANVKSPTETSSEKNITSYNLRLKYIARLNEPLQNLLDRLKRDEFVHQETKWKEFLKVFSGKQLAKKIVWVGTDSEIAYLISALIPYLEDANKRQWESTAMFFKPNDRETFIPNSLSKTNSNMRKHRRALLHKAINLFTEESGKIT